MKDSVFFIFDQDAYYASQNSGSSGRDGDSTTTPPKYLIPTAGVEKQSEDGRYSANGYNVYCNLDALTATLKRVFRNKAIPGQPTTSNGKPYKDLFYSVLKVNVDDIDNMIAVQEQIQALGYEASSNIEWIESTQKQYANIQAMLGGIGAISLLVAAIGITNTMMMSIYERTKEIGVMKVLGCDMRKYSGNVSDGGCRYRSGGWHRWPGDQLSDFHDHQQGRGGEWKYVEPVLYSALACRGVCDFCSSNRHGGRIFSVKASDEAEPAGCNPKRIIR